MAFSKAVDLARREGPAAARWRVLVDWRHPALALLAATVLICVRVASPLGSTALTSDESLYLSEAVSIAHGRLEYASGEPIVHRPPLYPATLAPVMRLVGNSIPAARVMPLAYAIGAVVALFLLGRRLFGANAAIIAALLAAATDAPGQLAGAFNVDTAAAMWLLLCMVVLAEPRSGGTTQDARTTLRRGAFAGALLGLAFLTKETAALWLPLPILSTLIAPKRVGVPALLGFYLAFAALAAPWAIWVVWHTHTLFKLEAVSSVEVVLGIAGAGLLATVGLLARSAETRQARLLTAALIATLAAVASLFVLESRPEPHDVDYLRTVPGWTVRVFATNVEPFPLIFASWAAALWRLMRHDDDRFAIPVACAGLIAPLYVFVADRGWEVRQLLPLVYLSYMILAWAIVATVAAIAGSWSPAQRATLLTAIVVVVMATAGVASRIAGGPPAVDTTADWQNPAQAEIASWLNELPQGSSILSSRLYATQLYVETDGRFDVRQLPTLAITLNKRHPEPVVVGTLFRYEDADLDRDAKRTWLYIRRYPNASYFVGLAAEDLESTLVDSATTHLVLSGDDAGFSSYSYVTNFEHAAAFKELERYDDGFIQSKLFAVDLSQAIDAGLWPLAIRWEDAQQIALDAGEHARTEEFWSGLAPNGVLLDGQLITPADMAALLVDA